jgi:hypothetical protein
MKQVIGALLAALFLGAVHGVLQGVIPLTLVKAALTFGLAVAMIMVAMIPERLIKDIAWRGILSAVFFSLCAMYVSWVIWFYANFDLHWAFDPRVIFRAARAMAEGGAFSAGKVYYSSSNMVTLPAWIVYSFWLGEFALVIGLSAFINSGALQKKQRPAPVAGGEKQ